MPVQFHGRIFQKFSRAGSSGNRQKDGTGLGLSIIRSMVERMGGTIGFKTAAGAGATFCFTVPPAD